MKNLYLDLWGAMKANGMTQEELAGRIGMCRSSMQQRMTGRICFKQDEMYKIAEVLGVPAERLPQLFPMDGVRVSDSIFA